jgi:ubiquinone/menaquinone biosynthesis C-methylase UbiE
MLPNFVQGDVMDMDYEDGHFGTVVLGEFLEHCTFEAAEKSLRECVRVLKDDGKIVVTFPRDSRPPEQQHSKDKLVNWAEGITSWHQTVWEDAMLEELFTKVGLVEESRTHLRLFCGHPHLGMILRKSNGEPGA